MNGAVAGAAVAEDSTARTSAEDMSVTCAGGHAPSRSSFAARQAGGTPDASAGSGRHSRA
jgi:hypothetical protein